MHKKIIEEASHEQLKDFAYGVFDMLKKTVSEDVYDDIEVELYRDVYGCHFNKWLLEKALCCMSNEDGSKGGHWGLDQTTMVAKQYDVKFEGFNQYDWCYVMNMIYSDYFGAVPDELSYYVKLSKKFLEDKDGKTGKAFNYYVAMNYNK